MANPLAHFETSMGSFSAEIFVDRMPITGGNFVRLAKEGFYDGLHFHRVINKFMIQFGCPHSRDPESRMAGTGDSPHGTIADEHTARISNDAGTLSMANAGANTGSSQFFINTVNNPYLDHFTPGGSRHPVFGKVMQGMDIISDIEGAPTAREDRPKTPIEMISVTIQER